LAKLADGSCWVRKLESTPVQTVVHGLAIDIAAANRFAGRLEFALQRNGWKTVPARTLLTSNGLVSFNIVLEAKLKPSESQIAANIASGAAAGNLAIDRATSSASVMQLAERSSP